MHCLVVDPNRGFAQLLSEELERLGHDVAMCTTARQAVEAVRRQKPDLAFLDMTLSQPDTLTLARALRHLDPHVRLMLIPLMGQQTVDHDSVSVQGFLPKPFFLPELPDRISAALDVPLSGGVKPVYQSQTQNLADLLPEDTREPEPQGRKPMSMDGEIVVRMHKRDTGKLDSTRVIFEGGLDEEDAEDGEEDYPDDVEDIEAEAPVAVSKAPAGGLPEPRLHGIPAALEIEVMEGGLSRERYQVNRRRIESSLNRLVEDVQADGALICHLGDLLMHTGNLQLAEAESVGAAVYQGWITSVQVARALGQEQIRFEQSIEGGTYLLYALSVARDAIMTVVMRNTRSLGLLRLAARQTAERIADLCRPF